MTQSRSRVGRWRGCAAVVAWLLCPAAARAQLTAPEEPATLEIGPVSLYPTVQVLDAGKDSNVFNESRNPKEDYTFTLSSKVLSVTKLGSNELLASAGSDYVWFQHYTQERSSSAVYAMRFNLSASRFKPFIGAESARIHTRPTPEIDTRADRLERYVVVGSNLNLTERTALTVSATASDANYQEGQTFDGVDLKEALDRQEQAYAGGMRYALTPLTTMALTGTYTSTTFANHERDARSFSFTPSLEFSPDAGIRGRASAGIERFTPDDPRIAPFTGLTFAIGVNWTLWGNTSFDVQGQRNISYSYKDNEPYYLLTGLRVAVTQKFFGPTDLTGAVERQFLSYRFRPGGVPDVDFEPDQTARDLVSGGFGVTLSRGLRVGFLAEHVVRKAPTDPQADFGRTRILTTVTIGS